MKQISLSKRIERYAKKIYPKWISKGKLEELTKSATHLKRGRICHYLAENGNRRAREMVYGTKSDGKPCPIVLEVEGEGNSVKYRFKKEEKPKPKQEVVFKMKDGVEVAFISMTS